MTSKQDSDEGDIEISLDRNKKENKTIDDNMALIGCQFHFKRNPKMQLNFLKYTNG